MGPEKGGSDTERYCASSIDLPIDTCWVFAYISRGRSPGVRYIPEHERGGGLLLPQPTGADRRGAEAHDEQLGAVPGGTSGTARSRARCRRGRRSRYRPIRGPCRLAPGPWGRRLRQGRRSRQRPRQGPCPRGRVPWRRMRGGWCGFRAQGSQPYLSRPLRSRPVGGQLPFKMASWRPGVPFRCCCFLMGCVLT